MKRLLFLLLTPLLCAHEPVIKYAFGEQALSQNAQKAAKQLKSQGVHLGLMENSPLFEGEGGLAALKMGYIELYAANAVQLQYVIGGIWPKLEAAKKGDDSVLRHELSELGFTLVSLKFMSKKTLIILANTSAFNRLSADQRRILAETL